MTLLGWWWLVDRSSYTVLSTSPTRFSSHQHQHRCPVHIQVRKNTQTYSIVETKHIVKQTYRETSRRPRQVSSQTIWVEENATGRGRVRHAKRRSAAVASCRTSPKQASVGLGPSDSVLIQKQVFIHSHKW